MKILSKSFTILFFAAVIGTSHEAGACPADGADWTSTGPTTAGGALAASGVSMTGLMSEPIIDTRDLSGPEYSAAPLSSSQEVLIYAYGSPWTVTFESPVQDLLLYGRSWRGTTGTGTDVEYTFDRPFRILSGFPNAVIFENTLVIPSGSFEHGILLFEGTVSSVSVINTDSPGGFSQQSLTFGRLLGPGCAADINGDCTVDVSDLVDVLVAWGECPGCPQDVTGDGVVDVTDLVNVLMAWGPC